MYNMALDELNSVNRITKSTILHCMQVEWNDSGSNSE